MKLKSFLPLLTPFEVFIFEFFHETIDVLIKKSLEGGRASGFDDLHRDGDPIWY